MGKLKPNLKQCKSVSRPTIKLKHHSIGKPVHKVPFKRFLMLQRRLSSLLDEKNSMEKKNKDLLDNLQAEKMLSASLKTESFYWQRLYHECMVNMNTYKTKQDEMVQSISASLREIDSIYPHMVAFSESVTSNKVRLSNVLNSLPSSDYKSLPRRFQDTGKTVNEQVKKNEKPMKQRVEPMVRGMLITKPKIMLERLMLPQIQDHERENNVMSTTEVTNQLTPIPEENEHEEDVLLSRISMRPRHKFGKRSWRVRRQEQLKQERERENSSSVAVAYDGDSSDTESNPPAMEPVVRFKDVSRLLQHTSLLKVDSARTGDAEGGGSNARQSEAETCHLPINIRDAAEDPLEGSSWMFNNNHNHCGSLQSCKMKQRSSIFKSDSSDNDENEILNESNESNLSTMNTLVIKDKTFTLPSNNSLPPADISHDSLDSSPIAEPDSTNNIDIHISDPLYFENICRNPSVSSRFSKKSIVFSSGKCNSVNKTQTGNTGSTHTSSVSVELSKVPITTPRLHSPKSKRGQISGFRSSFCDDSSPIENGFQGNGKRVRKPKNILYPGEEDFEPPPNKQIIKLGETKRKSSSDKKKSKEKTNKSSMKKSTKVPRNSDTSGNRSSESGDLTRTRRHKGSICYKESPLNIKQRRP